MSSNWLANTLLCLSPVQLVASLTSSVTIAYKNPECGRPTTLNIWSGFSARWTDDLLATEGRQASISHAPYWLAQKRHQGRTMFAWQAGNTSARCENLELPFFVVHNQAHAWCLGQGKAITEDHQMQAL